MTNGPYRDIRPILITSTLCVLLVTAAVGDDLAVISGSSHRRSDLPASCLLSAETDLASAMHVQVTGNFADMLTANLNDAA